MFDAHVAYRARQSPRATAIATPAGAFSYVQLDADVNRFATAFADLGLARREGVVALGFTDPYRRLVALLAFARLGVATSPPGDLRADVRLIDGADADPGPARLRLDKAWAEAMLAAEPRPLLQRDLDPGSTGRILLSSGTTAYARRVAFSWRRIDLVLRTVLTTYATGGFRAWIPWTGVNSSIGFAIAVAGWASGGQVISGVAARDLPEWLEALPPTLIGLTPIQLRQLLEALPAGFEPCPRHRLVVTGSLLPPSLAREARLRLTPDVLINYGATETSVIANAHAALLEDHPGVAGHAPPGTRIMLLGEDGAPGQAGEVMVAGERVVQAYEDDPEASAARFRDGWFATGDLGRWTPDGLLVLEGRADERLNLGGRKVMPAVLENAAFRIEGVLDAACFAVPGADGLDRAWLAVVTVLGFDRERLISHMAGNPDVPAPSYAWTEEIPRNDMGKVDRARLREAVLGALARPAP